MANEHGLSAAQIEEIARAICTCNRNIDPDAPDGRGIPCWKLWVPDAIAAVAVLRPMVLAAAERVPAAPDVGEVDQRIIDVAGRLRSRDDVIQALSAQAATIAALTAEIDEVRRPEDTAEAFIQAAVDRAPEPLRRLGEWLTHHLDDDEWKTAERMLLGATTALAAAREENARPAAKIAAMKGEAHD